MTKLCVICGKPLTGRQTVICSDRECHKERRKEYDCEYSRKYGYKYGWKHYQDNQEKRKEYSREWYWNNLEEKKKYRRKYYHDNPEREKGAARKYYQKNKERIKEERKEYGRKYYRNNTEKGKERSLKYHYDNWEKIKKQHHEWYLNNSEKELENARKRYRLSRGLPEDWDLSKESSIEIIMKRWLQDSNIEFVQQYSINLENSTRTLIDFYIPEANVCLYVDGDYWHSLSEVQERDIRINKAVEEIGHSVTRMTESEVLEGNRPWWIGELISTKW